jgi:hypothetical protein
MPPMTNNAINKRKQISLLKRVEVKTKQWRAEEWLINNGSKARFHEIYKIELKDRVLSFILNDLKKHPEIIVLGPAQGHAATCLKKDLASYGIDSKIDVFNITKYALDSELLKQKTIRKDHSKEYLPFERINEIEHAKLAKEIKHKYDVFVAPASVGWFTNSVPYALFQSSLLLKKNGRGYLQTLIIDKKNYNEITIAKRMVEGYNKTAKEKVEIEFKMIKDTISTNTTPITVYGKSYDARSVWVEITRKK